MRLIAVAFLLLCSPAGLALGQPLEQNFGFGAPPDVLGNSGPRGVRPPAEVAEAPRPRRRVLRSGREGRPLARRLRPRS